MLSLSSVMQDQPAKHLERFLHFLDRHHLQSSCRKCRDAADGFPCGQLHLRQGKPKRDVLHAKCAEACVDLKGWLKVLLAYNHHRAANETQKPAIRQLIDSPPWQHVTLLSDWRELLTLPIMWKETSEQWFANARKEISVFGALVSEHAVSSTSSRPRIEKTFFLVLSSILDHTCARTNMLVKLCLDRRKGHHPMAALHLLSDAGPHYRGYENLYFSCVTLVTECGIPVSQSWGVEKHMKADVDECFGWFNGALKWIKDNKIQVIEVEELRAAVQQRFDALKDRDPSSPTVRVLVDEDAAKPTTCHRLTASNLSITRTYCLSARPDSRYRLGSQVVNHIFTTKPCSIPLEDIVVETYTPTETQWRRGYWGKGRKNWDTSIKWLGLHDESSLTRRKDAQDAYLPHALDRRHNLPDFDSQLAKIHVRNRRRRARGHIRARTLKEKREAQNGESSSSSSTSSSSPD